jgi:hypothetical protein
VAPTRLESYQERASGRRSSWRSVASRSTTAPPTLCATAIKLGRSDFGLSQLGSWSLPDLKAIYDDHARILTNAVKNAYKALVGTGKISASAFLASEAKVSRDNAHTPMQWDRSPQAGFTTGNHSWLAVNPNYKQINAAQEESDPASVLNYMRALIALRAHTLTFVYGDYEDLDPNMRTSTPTLAPSAATST